MIGLTGGIGAGKSAVARRLTRHGAVIVDSDVLARAVVAPGTDGLAEVVAAFGAGVLSPDGELDRPALAAKVFGDERARRRLEQIIHPRVRSRAAALARAASADAIVVNDIPLLVETGQAPTFHLVVVVTAERAVRIGRLTALRGMTEQEAAARIDAQADDATRQAAADVLLPNQDDLAGLHARVDELWHGRLLEFERNLRSGTAARRPPELCIVDPDPDWPQAAARLIARIRHHTGDVEVHHIGSTAVPGLPAEDVIDLMLTVRTLDQADALAARLAAAGFPARPGEWADNARGLSGQTWPKRMHGSADPGRPAILHVRVAGSPGWRFALLMRDHLRAVPAAREAYATAKAELAERFPDRAGYARAKEPWFDTEAQAAQEWAEATGWQPG